MEAQQSVHHKPTNQSNQQDVTCDTFSKVSKKMIYLNFQLGRRRTKNIEHFKDFAALGIAPS